MISTPFILACGAYCLRHYNESAALSAWRSDRLLRSVLATCTFGGLSLLWITTATAIVLEAPMWPDALLAMYCGLWALLLLQWRAAIVAQVPRNECRW